MLWQGSLADKAKLYPGDTIVSVNGQLVNHHQEAVNAIDAVKDVVKLVMVGESVELSIKPKTAGNKAPLGVTLSDHVRCPVRSACPPAVRGPEPCLKRCELGACSRPAGQRA